MNKLPVPAPPFGVIPANVMQEANTVSGDLAGRDIFKTVVVNHASMPLPVQSTLGRLFQALMVEAAEDKVLQDYIAELQIFTRTVEEETVIGVEGKLALAGRDDQITMAMRMKELVFSQLRANIFSPSFQQIYALLLGKIHQSFETYITPAIQQNQDRNAIDQLVDVRIIQPILAEIECCGPGPFFTPQTIRGMVYFLTGNCHIKWH